MARRVTKVHYDLRGKPICGRDSRRAAKLPPLKVTIDRSKVTCLVCRNCFAPETPAGQ